jgi:hypothetical protein
MQRRRDGKTGHHHEAGQAKPPVTEADEVIDERTQSDKFKDLARELETNEDEAAFDHALKKVAKSEGRAANERKPKGAIDGPRWD